MTISPGGATALLQLAAAPSGLLSILQFRPQVETWGYSPESLRDCKQVKIIIDYRALLFRVSDSYDRNTTDGKAIPRMKYFLS